ncbi:MAG: transposase [Vicinamibacterales bacterium]
MPRPLRSFQPNGVYHVLNRGNDRQCLFPTSDAFEEFLELMAWAKRRSPVRLIAYCIMPNHWHFIIWAEQSLSIPRFLHRLCTTHAVKSRREAGTLGEGHIYQGRYHSFGIESEAYYFRAIRYVEANAVRSHLVQNARDWRWSSLAERLGRRRGLLDDGPLVLPANWPDLVEEALPADFLGDIRKRTGRDFKNCHSGES